MENIDQAETSDSAQETLPVLELPVLCPPVDCQTVTADGGVLKSIITEGTGDTPGLHSRCLGGCMSKEPSSSVITGDHLCLTSACRCCCYSSLYRETSSHWRGVHGDSSRE